MKTGEMKVASGSGRDPVIRGAMMAVRAGFLVAAALGVGMLVGLVNEPVLPVHIVAGALTLVGILATSFRALSQGKGGLALLFAGLILGAVGAAGALTDLVPGLLHLALMVVAVSLSEMTVAKINRA